MVDGHASQTHDLDVPPDTYEALLDGRLRHDLLRIGERPFAPGDVLLYREVHPGTRAGTGRSARASVSYVTWTGNQCALSPQGLDEDFAILSLYDVASVGKGSDDA